MWFNVLELNLDPNLVFWVEMFQSSLRWSAFCYPSRSCATFLHGIMCFSYNLLRTCQKNLKIVRRRDHEWCITLAQQYLMCSSVATNFPCDPNRVNGSLGQALTTKRVAFFPSRHLVVISHVCFGVGPPRQLLCGDHCVPHHNITSLAFSLSSTVIRPA